MGPLQIACFVTEAPRWPGYFREYIMYFFICIQYFYIIKILCIYIYIYIYVYIEASRTYWLFLRQRPPVDLLHVFATEAPRCIHIYIYIYIYTHIHIHIDILHFFVTEAPRPLQIACFVTEGLLGYSR